jgi:phosphatidylserine/phosphatidylglycerophosphate/cardiolipin synthase-like enzyme
MGDFTNVVYLGKKVFSRWDTSLKLGTFPQSTTKLKNTMRNRASNDGLEVSIVAGGYAALLSIRLIDNSPINKPDFLGFEIRRDDLTENESYPLRGFKYFPESAKRFDPGQLFDTDKHPVQSFFWEDFTVKPDHEYVYHVIPVSGKPKKLSYGADVKVSIRSEISDGDFHSVYFNRGVSGSLAYAREFENKKPDEMTEEEKQKARVWLSRGLEEALLGFIDKAIKNKFGLRAAFYEFTYSPVLEKLKKALAMECDVQIVYDSRAEAEENDEAIKAVGLDESALTPRTNDPQVPSHNKFMILMDGETPLEVWTGSTNITDKGILGHSNVGHILKDKGIAEKYLAYWKMLQTDPNPADLKKETGKIQPDIDSPDKFTDDVTVFFSPRKDKSTLKMYARFIESAAQMVCGIFPFSFSKDMKTAFAIKTDHLKYILVDKIGNADGITKPDNNTIIVNGAYFAKAMFDWLDEINSGILLNKNHNPIIGTNYVHNKLLLIDPLGAKPVILMGSANFSDPSIASNDENTLVIKGGKDLRRVADIYFTEFYRMFHHFFVRKATQEINKGKVTSADAPNNPIHLKTDNSWVKQFNKDGVKMQEQLRSMPLDL